MKYAITSTGEVIALSDNQNVTRIISEDVRIKELQLFVNEFTALLKLKGIDTTNKRVCFILQPFYIIEKVLIFTKTEFSSSSRAVKLSNEIEKHPEILASKERTDFFKSIFPENGTGQTRWYYLNVGSIAFERNFYDSKRINIKYIAPVSYAKFIRNLKQHLVTEEDANNMEVCSQYKLISNGVNIYDTDMLLSSSFERDIINGQESSFDKLIFNLIEVYKAKKYTARDEESNKATACLIAINECEKNIYIIYQQVKTCIRKIYKDAFNIRYKGNQITAMLSNTQKLCIYVSGTTEKPRFIIGGKAVVGIDALRRVLKDTSLLQEAKWFNEKVRPNIAEKENKSTAKATASSKKDEIGWNKKRKCNRKG